MDQNSTVVFVCEHGAAKSVIAAAYFNKLARERGLPQQAIARGTNPDPVYSQNTVTGLLTDGLTPTEARPRRLSAEELRTSSMVIAFCNLSEDYRYENALAYWDDVPPVSEDYEQARDSILAHLNRLINFYMEAET